ncbi:MAG: hypothetical protein AAF804_20200 [Bacteroidota bacterium]
MRFLIWLGLIVPNLLIAQDFSGLNRISFESAEDYALQEDQVLSCCKYLLEHPIYQEDLKRLQATQFMLRWAEGTPDLSIALDTRITDLAAKNSDLLGVFIAAWIEAGLESEGQDLPEADLRKAAYQRLYRYIKAGNNVKQKGAIKKFVKMGDAGRQEEWR